MKPGPAASALCTSGSRSRSATRVAASARGVEPASVACSGAWVQASKLGCPRIDHRRVGGEVAMGRLARRLDDEAAEIEVARQFSRRYPLFEQARDARLEVGENIHYSSRGESQCQDVAVSVMAGLVPAIHMVMPED